MAGQATAFFKIIYQEPSEKKNLYIDHIKKHIFGTGLQLITPVKILKTMKDQLRTLKGYSTFLVSTLELGI